MAAKALLILLFAGALSYFDWTSELNLGLDLKGGTQLDYSIDLSSVPATDRDQIVEGVKEVIRRRVDTLGVSEPSIYISNVGNEYHIIVELAGITDIEQAKAVVGKTIQLEFKEEETNPDNTAQASWANDEAQTFVAALKDGGDFVVLGEQSKNGDPEQVHFTQQESQDLTLYDQTVQDAIAGRATGDVVGPIELVDGYGIDASGNVSPFKGMGVIQIVDRGTDTQSTDTEAKVSARHILVAYQGATNADESITRTKDEAYARIEEVKAKLNDGESIEDLAAEYSDDPGSKDKGGDLGSFGKGVMTEAFEDAAFALGKGETSEIIETEFGYHLITVYDKVEGGSSDETVDTAALNVVVWSTTASPWKQEAGITGKNFKHADVAFNSAYQPYVSITFDDEGAQLFEEMTGRNLQKKIAIFVGGDLISAPVVQSKISGGQAQISGNFTLEEAQDLARDLNTGAIPAPVTLSGQHNISATLGQEALDQSMHAGLIGVLLLALFMILYYRLPGFIATIALAIYSLLIVFVIKVALPLWLSILISLGIFAFVVHLILKNRDSGGEKFIAFIVSCFVLFFLAMILASQITLTLAGIAGVILSIGMAVDANVLIFERMKEEMKEGRTLHQAIDEGFKRAWDSIRDSNFSSLITCGILFYFGSSIIRGFATNLALGILLSMFSAIMLTRTLLTLVSDTKLADKLWLWSRVKKEGRMWPIMKQSKIWAGISGFLALVAIVAITVFGLNLGLDFTGGTMMDLKISSTEETTQVTTETVTEDINTVAAAIEADFGTPQVVSAGENEFIIRMKHVTEDQHNALIAQFKEGGNTVEEVRFTTVGPTIGDTLKTRALVALALTSLFIVLYIAFAFRRLPREVSAWRFGVSAIVALIHDVTMVIGFFVILGHFYGVEIDALFITAVLTVMGFSVHDTIVVFDRIRENLRYREGNETLRETTNKALNQTMARSINTSLCTLITIVALLIFGAESIRMFVLALTVGIIAGTYSSIFIASPLMVWWTEWSEKRS
jgi:SecD/SecF fusion protein